MSKMGSFGVVMGHPRPLKIAPFVICRSSRLVQMRSVGLMMFVQTGSRLECVKAAVLSQLKQLRDEHPTRKVALVTFESDVSVLIAIIYFCIES